MFGGRAKGKTAALLEVSVLRTGALKKYMQFCIDNNQVPRQQLMDNILSLDTAQKLNLIIDKMEEFEEEVAAKV